MLSVANQHKADMAPGRKLVAGPCRLMLLTDTSGSKHDQLNATAWLAVAGPPPGHPAHSFCGYSFLGSRKGGWLTCLAAGHLAADAHQPLGCVL